MDREHDGYRIISHYKFKDNSEIVLGFNPEATEPYVVWDCVNEENCYNEKYFTDRLQAIKEFKHQINMIEHEMFNSGSTVKGGRAM